MTRLLSLLAVLALLATPAVAMASEAKPTLAEIEDAVMCTVCGVPLSLAREAPAAKRERALITELIGAGKSKSQIEDALVKQYGEQVLATPRSNGFDLWAWLIPAGLILLAAVGLFALINSWRRGPADEPIAEPVQPLDDADAARVDAELRARD
jgi:cytochrome c-type biogenesis protein CcmH/NrfF